jgi:HupE / UreJ protein
VAPTRKFVHFALWLLLIPGAAAHEVPSDVVIRAFLKPSGNQARLIVRAPLKAMRDVEFPLRGPGYLDLSRTERHLRDAATLWIVSAIEIYEDDSRLPAPRIAAVRASLPSEGSFGSYDEALAHVTGPALPVETEVIWDQAMLDVLFEYPIRSEISDFSIRTTLARLGLRVLTSLRFEAPGGVVRAFELHDDPGLVRLDPRWHQAALRFVESGFFHILDGTDHLLFLLCLVIPFRKFRPLVGVVTAFTAAHSITLIASAYDMAPSALWFPPMIEMLIALSIVYMAFENILGKAAEGHRWMVAFGFGLIHGFGFSFALRETLQFAGTHLLTSLVAFNLGVELGQLLVLVALVPALSLLFRYAVAERMGIILLSALVAHTGWHWMTERAELLSQYQISWPVWNAALLAAALRWAMLAVVAAGAAWLISGLAGRTRRSTHEDRDEGKTMQETAR